jgi:hypothetical protein
MAVSVARKLQAHRDLRAEVHPVAMTLEQVRLFGLVHFLMIREAAQ